MEEWDLSDLTNNPEHELFDNVNVEMVDIAGFPIQYYVKTLDTASTDTLYGEDTITEYSEGYESKIIYQPEDDVSMIDIFGFSPNETLQFAFMPKTIFTRDVAILHLNEELKPQVGDVIVTLWNNKRYELTNVGSEQSVFQGKKMIWEFTLTPYNHSEDSDSAESIVNFLPDDDDFPDINKPGFETKELSGYGDNDWIEDESDDIDLNPDSAIYGY